MTMTTSPNVEQEDIHETHEQQESEGQTLTQTINTVNNVLYYEKGINNYMHSVI